jgi:DNA (cytosine-5)-methyltransferase 1
MEEIQIGAMRGRNPDDPNDRGRSNGKFKQRLEINRNGTSNTITSVQKIIW